MLGGTAHATVGGRTPIAIAALLLASTAANPMLPNNIRLCDFTLQRYHAVVALAPISYGHGAVPDTPSVTSLMPPTETLILVRYMRPRSSPQPTLAVTVNVGVADFEAVWHSNVVNVPPDSDCTHASTSRSAGASQVTLAVPAIVRGVAVMVWVGVAVQRAFAGGASTLLLAPSPPHAAKNTRMLNIADFVNFILPRVTNDKAAIHVVQRLDQLCARRHRESPACASVRQASGTMATGASRLAMRRTSHDRYWPPPKSVS